MTDLIDTTEMYLKVILELEEDGIVPMRARIAERLDHSGPTVSQTVARMERDGLLRVGDDRQLEFTETGRVTAIEVMRKHRLAERLLLEVIGLDWHLVHEEACRWEHVMSEAVELKIAALLSDVSHSPFGMPVPGLDLIGLTASQPTSCRPVTAVESGDYQLVRIGEPVQVDEEFLLQLQELGLLPGARVSVTVEKTGWLLSASGKAEGMLLDELIASHLFVGE
jgi:DtxR family Mn-dependent transcriptional regulator